jgi:PAS domain S-box-containing protein
MPIPFGATDMDAVRVLAIEDNPADVEWIRQELVEWISPEFKLFSTDRLASGVQRLQAEQIDVVLLAPSLPDSSGIETLKRVLDIFPNVPIVVLTGQGNETQAMEAMRHGAQDYLVKGQTGGKGVGRTLLLAMERKRAERFQQLSTEILCILNEPLAFSDAVDQIITAIKQETQFDAVGVRLLSGEDFPYFAQKGFPEDFLVLENSLIVHDKDGEICRDENGIPQLECTCGLVLRGKTDSGNPLFTAGGSAWTNNAVALLEMAENQGMRHRLRDHCIQRGYSSVALIPIRADREIVGLLQLNDRNKDRFTIEIIRLFEGVCVSIGSALMRIVAEEALNSSRTRYHALMEQSFEALAVIDIQTQEIVEVNRRFTEMTGFSLPEDEPLYVKKIVVESQSNLDEIYNIVLKKQRVMPAEPRIFRHKNGIEFPVERAGTVVSIDGRDFYLASMRDMTQERRREAELTRDVELARRVQQGLLPELPDSSFVTVRTFYQPVNFVSGDSYHLEWHNEGKLLRGFLIDVSGHGLATAIQTSSLNVLLREPSVARLPLLAQLRRVNARVAKYFADGAYAAILGFELDFSLREIRYVGAGITQFYANGAKIATPGMFVGLWDNAEFIAGKFQLSEGDSFYFLTDGMTDALAQPENADVLSPSGKNFDADVAALKRLAESSRLRDDATGICLKVRELP